MSWVPEGFYDPFAWSAPVESPPEDVAVVSDAPVVADARTTAAKTIDYYGNVFDAAGTYLGTDYYKSQAWTDAAAANTAQQTAINTASALVDAAEQARAQGQPDPALEAAANAAVAAAGAAVQAYEHVGGGGTPEQNAVHVQTAIQAANQAQAAAGLPPVSISTTPPGNVMTPGAPSGPVDTTIANPQGPWQVESSGGDLGGLVQLATLGTLAVQVLRWLK